MPSPFPGMDPYLEDPAFWPDFHGQMIYACREQLLDRLPDGYDATVDERLRLVERPQDDDERGPATRKEIRPDVAVTWDPAGRPGSGGGTAVANVTSIEPVVVAVPGTEEIRDRWIEIHNRADNSIVTVIEILSPTNKSADGFGEYQAKRQAVLRQQVNLVELDLLVGGRRSERAGPLPPGDYLAIVARADRPLTRFVYAWPARHGLPTVPVPLKSPTPDVLLDLAAAFTTAYDRGRYHRRLRYGRPPLAPLQGPDKGWAVDIVRRSTATPEGQP